VRPLPRVRISLRALAFAGLVLVVFLYYRPLRSYVDIRAEVDRRSEEVRRLGAEQAQLRRRLARSKTDDALLRDARRLLLVRPGERLFVVKGTGAWQRARRATIGGDG